MELSLLVKRWRIKPIKVYVKPKAPFCWKDSPKIPNVKDHM